MKSHKLVVCISFLALPVLARTQATSHDLLRLVGEGDGYVREVRHHLHLYPEVGGKEVETVKYLKRELARIGRFELHDVPGSTGFYAVLDTHKEGKTIGLRADIDGLPITEQPTNAGRQPKPYVSKNVGVTQGCGHDAHMAILLGTARILWQLREELTGRFVLIFEEGEETNTGIRPMIAALKDFPFDAIYGSHVSSLVPTGQLFIKEGFIMAGMATLALHVNGRGGHASRPDHAVSPIPAAAEVVTALGQAWQNQRDLTKTVTLGITQMEGGQVYNVIPNSVFLGGTMRFFDRQTGEQALSVVKRVSEHVAAAHRCTVSYDSVMTVNLPPVVNDIDLTRLAAEAAQRLFPGRVTTDEAYVWWASETFALYSQLAPTVFVHVGTRNEAAGITAAHHTDTFDVDDDALQYGVGAMAAFAVKTSNLKSQTSNLITLPDMDAEGGADLFLAQHGVGRTPQRDYFTTVSDASLTILPRFHTMLQTTGWTCGNVSALMVLHYLGIDRETEASLASQMLSRPHVGTTVGNMHRYFAAQPDLHIVSSSYHTDYNAADTLSTGFQGIGNLPPTFRSYEEAGRFFQRTLRNGLPIIVNWTSWGGHWTVIIGYDDNGTPDLPDDDVIVMADPYDTFDGTVDGYNTVPLVQFFYNWQGWLAPKPWQLQPYIVVGKNS